MSDYLIKTLSSNDVGETGSHQAGILVPKVREALEFFPPLDELAENPRSQITFVEEATGLPHVLNFIHYNGKRLGTSTRDEYRLTGMTRYPRSKGARPGDEIHLAKSQEGYTLSVHRQGAGVMSPVAIDDEIIVLSGAWVTIQKGRNA